METDMTLQERYFEIGGEETRRLFETLGISHQFNYKYRYISVPISEIKDFQRIEDNDRECYLVYESGEDTIVRGDADDLYIKLVDLRNSGIADG